MAIDLKGYARCIQTNSASSVISAFNTLDIGQFSLASVASSIKVASSMPGIAAFRVKAIEGITKASPCCSSATTA
jgi:hypothetical protein